MYDFENMDQRLMVFADIFRLSNRLQTAMDQTLEDLTAKQWFVAAALGMFGEPPTLRQLADMCDSSHQNTKQLVLKLRAKGFVRLEEDENDRRAIRIHMTPECAVWGERNTAQQAEFIDQMFQGLSAQEVSGMLDTQKKIYNNLKEMRE